MTSTAKDTRHPEERAGDDFRAAVTAGASPGELARLYGTWATAAKVATDAEDAKATSHHQAWRARSEEYQRLFTWANNLGWRRPDGLRRRTNVTAAEYAAQEPQREQWKRDAAAYLEAGTVDTVDADLLGAPPVPGPPPARRFPRIPGPYQDELHDAAASGG
jgi:hypothetical protein